MSFWRKSIRFIRGRRTAVCLNSSYFGFFAHAGFLAGLEEIGRPPDYLSGASAGALVSGLYGAGYSPAEMSQLFLRKELASAFREWSAPIRLARTLMAGRGATGALSGKRALDLLKQYVGDRRLEELDLPVAISVANLSRNRSEVKMEGPLAEYILASCAVPGMFAMQEVEGDHFWDGGIADPAPIEHWLSMGEVDRIVVHIVDSNERPVGPYRPRFWSAMSKSHELISEEIVRLKTELARKHGKRLDVIITRTPRLGPHKLAGGANNVRLGHASALRHQNLFL